MSSPASRLPATFSSTCRDWYPATTFSIPTPRTRCNRWRSLAAEITAKTGRDPGEHYRRLTERFGDPLYRRLDAPASREQKAVLAALSAEQVTIGELAGEAVTAKLTQAPGNGAAIGGLKVVTENGWFAARPSGTEEIYKIYAESFRGEDHLARIIDEAQAIVGAAFTDAGL